MTKTKTVVLQPYTKDRKVFTPKVDKFPEVFTGFASKFIDAKQLTIEWATKPFFGCKKGSTKTPDSMLYELDDGSRNSYIMMSFHQSPFYYKVTGAK